VFAVLLASTVACRPPAPEPRTCGLPFSDQGDVRLFVVGHAFRFSDVTSYETFDRSIRERVEEIRPCLSNQRSNLIAFPEDTGLVAWFLGRRAMLARGAWDTDTAFNALYAGYYRQSDEYRRRFPGISPARALTLALSDQVWRSLDRAFGGAARELNAWVVTSANLPYSDLAQDRDEVWRLGDPDAPPGAGVYVARSPEVRNAALLYGPDGTLAGRVDKAYLTDPEEQLLDLSNGPLAELGVFELPFGRVGAAISRDAFYAPFSQRMEDLGAELVLQPEAWGGWTVEVPEGGWLPDVILASGWTQTQKYRGLRYSAAPMLLGNLFDTTFDGQTWIARKTAPDQPRLGFVGSQSAAGWLAIGPWTFPDPVASRPGLSLAERRRTLRAQGEALGPRSGARQENAYADSLIAADLPLYGETRAPPAVAVSPSATFTQPVAPSARGNQVNPDGAYDAGGRLYAVWSDGRSGVLRVYLASSGDHGATWSEARAVTEDGPSRQLRPTVAAGAAGRVLVAWQEARGGGPERILVALSTDGGATFTTRELEPGEAAQWEPDAAFSPDGTQAGIAFTDFREGLAPKVRWSRSADAGASWAPSSRVDLSNVEAAKVEGSQLQPSLAWALAGPAVAFIDYRARDWRVWVAPPAGGGLGEAVNVTGEGGGEILAGEPQLSASAQGELLVAWDDQRERRGHHDVRGAVLPPGGAWQPLPKLLGGAEDNVFKSRFRPSPARVGIYRVVVFQDLVNGKAGLSVARGEAAALPSFVAASRFDDTGDAPNHLTRPRVVVRPDGSRAVALFEDDRDGFSRVRCSDPF